MTKLVCAGFALALSLAACVTDDDVGTPPQPTDGQDDETQTGSDPVEPDPNLPCASFDSKGDGPCVP
jgi:hypothetical protein